MKPPILYAEGHKSPPLIRCCGCGDVKPLAYRRSDNSNLKYCEPCAGKLPHAKLSPQQWAIACKIEEYRPLYANYRQRVAKVLNVHKNKVHYVIEKLGDRGYKVGYEPNNIVINSKGKEVRINDFQFRVFQSASKYLLRQDYHICIAKDLEVDALLVNSTLNFLRQKRGISIPNSCDRRQNFVNYIHDLIRSGIPRSSLIKKASQRSGYKRGAASRVLLGYEKEHGRVKQYSASETILDLLISKGSISKEEIPDLISLDKKEIKWGLRVLISRGDIRKEDNLLIPNARSAS
ncbi:hypothetical protein H6G36_25385 [Anabaena minutissima FACHB-250]|nr:hypothetical protein [Anabaena minutissima FACHB-250]